MNDGYRNRTRSSIVMFALFVLTPSFAAAASVQCMVGMTRCVKSQGTQIPSKQVLEMLDRCSDFTLGDLGQVALRLSSKEIMDRSGGRITPLVRAWTAFDDLYSSPLTFERKSNAEDTKYFEIKRSCQQLHSDFYDDSKWTK